MAKNKFYTDLNNGNVPFNSPDLSGFLYKIREEKREQELENLFKKEGQLFLDEMKGLKRPHRNKGNSGFKIADQCTWLQKKIKIKKDKDIKMKEQNIKKPVAHSDPEIDFFKQAMRGTKPLSGKGRKVAIKPQTPESPLAEELAFRDMIEQQYEFTVYYSDEYMEGHVTDMDELVMNRLRNGSISPEANIDLHGLNAIQAFETIRVFFKDAWFKGLRMVLIITGRGRNSPAGQGILRRRMHEWLTREPFKRIVLAFCTARPQDGGTGGIYVLLRKFRKKGRVHWDTMPADADLFQ